MRSDSRWKEQNQNRGCGVGGVAHTSGEIRATPPRIRRCARGRGRTESKVTTDGTEEFTFLFTRAASNEQNDPGGRGGGRTKEKKERHSV